MPNQNRNGLQDLDILDLDDLLSEEDTSAAEKPQEEKKKTPDKSQAETKKAADKPQEEKKKAADKPQAKKKKAAEAPDEEDGDGICFVELEPASGSRTSPEEAGTPDPARNRKEQDRPRTPQRVRRGEKPQPMPHEEEPGRAKRLPLHLILPILIAAVLVIAIVRFFVWSKGSDLNIDKTGSEDRFNIEVNDNMVYLPDSKLEGHEDDGVTTILCLGNEPFSEDTSDSGLAAQIAKLGDCNVINAAFPDSQVTCENAVYSTENLDSMDDIFNLFYVSYAISIGDFSSLKTVASVHTEDPAYMNSVEALESTDFDKVDIIAVMYDGIDYINGMAMQNPDVPDELTTYVGSLINSFKLLQEKYPYIRIVFLSPYYAEYDGSSSRTTDLGNGTIVNYFQWAYDTCGSCSVSFLDNYYGSVNETNYKEYLSDGIHLNAEGRTKVADHFVYKVLQDNYDEYNAQTLSVAK